MKKEGHPLVNNVIVTCVCGNSFETLSTNSKIAVGICSKCHPFFTGQHKFVDAERRIDKFMAKFGYKETIVTSKK